MLLVDHLDFQKLQAQNVVIHTLTTAPGTPVEGQLYMNTTNHLLNVHNGTAFRNIVIGPTSGVTTDTIPLYDGTSGAILKAGYAVTTTLGDPGDNNTIPTEAAVRNAIGAAGGGTVTSVSVGTGLNITSPTTTPNITQALWEFSEKTGDLVGTDRLVAVNSAGDTHYAETISNIPLSIFNDDITSGIDLTLGLDADTGGPSTVSTSQTLTISGTTNQIETSVSGQTVTIGLPDDITIGNDLTITGNLTVNGTTTTVNTSTLSVDDPLIHLGDSNSADSADLGIYWEYTETVSKWGGIFRDASDANKTITFFESLESEPTTTVNTAGTGYALADIKFGIVRNGTWNGSNIDPIYGGTGLSSFSAGSLLYASGANTWAELNVTNNAVLISSASVPVWETLNVNGELLIGGTSGPTGATLTAGTGIDITNGDGTISIEADTTILTRKVSANLGDGDGSYTWNHGLGLSVDTDIIVQVWGVTQNTDVQVFPTITVVDGNNITFDFGFNITSGDYKAVLIY